MWDMRRFPPDGVEKEPRHRRDRDSALPGRAVRNARPEENCALEGACSGLLISAMWRQPGADDPGRQAMLPYRAASPPRSG